MQEPAPYKTHSCSLLLDNSLLIHVFCRREVALAPVVDVNVAALHIHAEGELGFLIRGPA